MNKVAWRFWLAVFLSITLAACASRERKEEKRAAKEERAEAKRQARQERAARRSAQQAGEEDAAPTAKPSRSKPAAAAAAATAPAAKAEEASSTIVFIRIASDKTAASLFDVTDSGAAKLIGITQSKTKLRYSLKPGQYTFMVVGDAADFMQATIDGGKTYYVLVTRTGAARARFSFKPVRGEEADTSRFATWDKSARLVKMTSNNRAWAESNSAEIESKRERWWPVWSNQSESERAAQTLNAEDGR